MTSLPDGIIFRIARDADIAMRGAGDKRSIRCPFHDDKHASAFLSSANIFYCSVCTPGRGLSAKEFATKAGVPWAPHGELASMPQWVLPQPQRSEPEFSPAMAAAVWHAAHARARDDEAVNADRAVYDYVQGRGLLESWELGAFGTLGPRMDLPSAVREWADHDYRLVAPLYGSIGELTNIQGRAIGRRTPKVMFPKGSVARGCIFACSRGLQVLRGSWTGQRTVLLAEGLTDHLALTIAAPIPVLSSPGTGIAPSAIGLWVKGCDLVLGLDRDQAGDNAIAATAHEAFQLGANTVRRIQWPRAANDACEALERVGAAGLSEFLQRLVVGGAA